MDRWLAQELGSSAAGKNWRKLTSECQAVMIDRTMPLELMMGSDGAELSSAFHSFLIQRNRELSQIKLYLDGSPGAARLNRLMHHSVSHACLIGQSFEHANRPRLAC